jgi:hypothetical protein
MVHTTCIYDPNHKLGIRAAVSTATGYGLDDRGWGFQFPAGAGNFSLSIEFRTTVGPPNLQSNGYREREADNSPSSSAEVKNAWHYTSTPSTSSWHGA